MSDEFEVPEVNSPTNSVRNSQDLSSSYNAGNSIEPEAPVARKLRSRKFNSELESTPGLHRFERLRENYNSETENEGVRLGLTFPQAETGNPRIGAQQPPETNLPIKKPGFKPVSGKPLAKDSGLSFGAIFEDVTFLEHFHLIFRQLGITPSLENPTVIGITSSVRGEGRTITALGLAQAISLQIPQPVLLLEADLNQSTLAADLGLVNRGLSEYLRDELSLDDLVQCTGIADLSLIVAGEAQGEPLKILRSERFSNLISLLTRQYAAIVVDMPPLSMTAESSRLMNFVDQVLMVVEANTTPAKLAKAALRIIPADKRAGVVLNRTLTPLGPFKWLRKLFIGHGA